MPAQPLGPTGLLAQSMTLPAGSQSMSMGGMGLRAQGMDGRKKAAGFAAQYLVVGGGAGGGCGRATSSYGGQGGGAGAVIFDTALFAPGSYPVVVGAGGPGAVFFTNNADTSGGLSSLGAIVALGGGSAFRSDGQNTYANNPTGGSGSGGYYLNFGGLPVDPRYGNKGGDGGGLSGGAGGGGAGSAGTNATASAQGFNGGAARSLSITGAAQDYGGGGGGGTASGGAPAGTGGGNAGNGGSSGGAGGNAVANRGGGGGGGSGDGANGTGGNGGSGVVIFAYPSPTQLCTGGTVTSYLNGSTRWWVHTFTSNGTLVVP